LAENPEGTRGAQGVGGCWAPRGDWLDFKPGKQLLQKYIVHY